MRRTDDVFFFTLIDFLLQVFFFGLLIFVAGQALRTAEEREQQDEVAEREKLLKATGVSNLTELTDLLTKMAPLDQLRGTSEFISRNGGPQALQVTIQAAAAAGGVGKLKDLQQKVNEQDKRIAQLEGWGKASCIPNVMVNGKLQPKSVATVVVTDDSITLESPEPEMHALLKRHDLDFAAVQRLGLSDFRARFAPVVSQQPECRYFLSVVTKTKYLDPMRAVWSAFRTQ